MGYRFLFSLLFLSLFIANGWGQEADPLPWTTAWDAGMDIEYINKAFDEVDKVIQAKGAPGAVGAIIKDGSFVARRALGNMQSNIIYRSAETGQIIYTPLPEPMLESTLFDLASVTKMIATTTSVMILMERGKIELDQPVCAYIPEFGARGKEKITVRHLLTHTSGLPAWYPFYLDCVNREEVFQMIYEDVDLVYKPGDKRIYSDLGFITLGRLVEVVSGERLDRFAKLNIFDPLGMKDTTYLPWKRERLYSAPTEYDPLRNRALRGIVHDENARALGGVSGHAGLFSTANDLAIFAQTLLNKGEFKGVRILSEKTIETMLTPQITDEAMKKGSGFLQTRKQLLGWWGMDDAVTMGDMGGLPSVKAFGHSGFTGTMICIDPEHKAAAILLTNAVHPRREDTQKMKLYRGFYLNVSKALVGDKNVNAVPEG